MLLSLALSGFARFAADGFTAITNALAAVRLGGTEPANGRGHLSESRFVSGVEHEHGALRIRRDVARDRSRQLHRSRMREAELQGDDFALHLGAVTGADQLERTLVTFGGTLDHAGQERAAETLQASRIATLCAALH